MTAYEEEMIQLSRSILADPKSTYQLVSPAVGVLEFSSDPRDIALCKIARTRMQVVESKFQPLNDNAETLQAIAEKMQFALIGFIVASGLAFIAGQVWRMME